ncbi:MAG TPA: nuclear transport factor 2 family protein [Actinomycetes bacterium]|jgi:ketosteroid isomerase-like protein|nr:nuclear transport factor 2 family protein [Actinomycetes bacterium]
MSNPSPRKVFESLLQGISDRRWHELADLYAEDTVVELPFAPGAPTRLEGREAVRAHFTTAAVGPLKLRASNVVIHYTDDPEVVIAEFEYHGQVTTTGRAFQVSNIQVLRVRNGQIVSSRDYHDHLAIAAAVGGLHQLVSSLTDQGAA